MSTSGPVGSAERVLLGLSLSIGGMFTAFPIAGVAIAAGLHEPIVSVIAALGMVLGVVAMAHVAPRVFPNAVRFSISRRILAGLVGILAAVVGGRGLVLLGLDADALSNLPSADNAMALSWAIAQEGMYMVTTLGTMLAAASTALGRPLAAEDPIAQ